MRLEKGRVGDDEKVPIRIKSESKEDKEIKREQN